jgi:serine protease inhibitor ecotin
MWTTEKSQIADKINPAPNAEAGFKDEYLEELEQILSTGKVITVSCKQPLSE